MRVDVRAAVGQANHGARVAKQHVHPVFAHRHVGEARAQLVGARKVQEGVDQVDPALLCDLGERLALVGFQVGLCTSSTRKRFKSGRATFRPMSRRKPSWKVGSAYSLRITSSGLLRTRPKVGSAAKLPGVRRSTLRTTGTAETWGIPPR